MKNGLMDLARAVVDDSQGTIYLIHFNQPLAHARHYLGWTTNLQERLYAHETGNGARLMEVISERGITWRLVRTWEGGRDLERRLKAQHHNPRLCPICNPRERVDQ